MLIQTSCGDDSQENVGSDLALEGDLSLRVTDRRPLKERLSWTGNVGGNPRLRRLNANERVYASRLSV